MTSRSRLIQAVLECRPVKHTFIQMHRVDRDVVPFQTVREISVSRVWKKTLQRVDLRCFAGADLMLFQPCIAAEEYERDQRQNNHNSGDHQKR